MNKKKRYTAEEKTQILREYLEKQISISDLAEKYGVHPNAIYVWKKNILEGAPASLSKQNAKSDKQRQELEKQITELKATLANRESLIADLVEDNINLKKKTNGELLTKGGLNRK